MSADLSPFGHVNGADSKTSSVGSNWVSAVPPPVPLDRDQRTLQRSDTERLTIDLKDADKIGDNTAFDAASRALWGKLLAEEQPPDASQPIDVLAEVLPQLSLESATGLLLATRTSLEAQLSSLPPPLHALAVHAAFPSLSADSSLQLNCAAHTMPAVTAVLQTCAALPTGFQCMHLSSLVLDSSAPATKCCVESLQLALQAMPAEVSLRGATITHEHLSMVLLALLQDRNLKALELSSMRVTCVDQYPLDAVLAAGLAHMSSLKRLSLRGVSTNCAALTVRANSLLSPALWNLSGLTSLDLGCGISDASALCKIVSRMLQLLSLTLVFDAAAANSADQLSKCLCKLTKLESLKLSEMTSSEGHPRVASSLASSLRGLMHMRSLDLSGCSMVDAGVLLLASSVQLMSRLDSLSLRTEKLSEGTLVALFSNLAVASSFKKLSINVDVLKHDGTGQLIYSRLSDLRTLQELEFNMLAPPISAGDDTIGSCLDQLSFLSLSHCSFDAAGSQCLLASLGGLSSLQALEMRDTVLGEQGTKVFAAGIAVATALQSLVLGADDARLPYSHAQAMVIAPALGRLSRLTRLDLSGAFRQEGLEVLCHVLGKLSKLRKLQVCRNALDADGAGDLKLAVSSLVDLQHLDVGSCSLSRSATASITLGVGTLRSLEHLDLSGATVNERNVTPVVGSLQKLHALQYLSLQSVLSKCSSQQERVNSLSALADGLCRLSNLSFLDLSSNEIGDDGAKAVAKMLRTGTALRSVQVSTSGLSHVGAEEILAALDDSDPARCFELSQQCRQLVAMS